MALATLQSGGIWTVIPDWPHTLADGRYMISTCDRLTVRILDENYIDMLLTDAPPVHRFGMAKHFDPKPGCRGPRRGSPVSSA